MTEARAKPDFAPHFLEGVEHFNARRFWEAHEAWETLWLSADSDLHQFLQGLIQLAAAYHHVQRGTVRGGLRLFDAALRRLEAFPADYCGIDRSHAERSARADRERLVSDPTPPAEYPRLRRSPSPMPPLEKW